MNGRLNNGGPGHFGMPVGFRYRGDTCLVWPSAQDVLGQQSETSRTVQRLIVLQTQHTVSMTMYAATVQLGSRKSLFPLTARMTGLELYLILAPLGLLAAAGGVTWWWTHTTRF